MSFSRPAYEDAALSGDIDVTDDLDMTGAGVDDTLITTTRLSPERAFDVLPGASLRVTDLAVSHLPYWFHPLDCGRAFRNRGGNLELTRVKILNNAMRGSGGGICNAEGGTLTVRDSVISANAAELLGEGAGIYNQGGSVTLERVVIASNWAYVLDGGGIYSSGGTLVVRDSAILDNRIQDSSPFGPRRGGGIAAGGQVTLTNVTINGNHSEGTNTVIGVPDSRGGGFYLFGQAQLTNVTIADNDSETTAGGLYAEPGADVTLANTIIADNTGGDCEGTITSAGHNIDGDDTCSLTAPGDMPGVDPMLVPLADNGGPTRTHALLPGSPAIDAGNDAACPDADQRGAPRPMDGDGSGSAACDIGAYEAGGIVPTPPPITPTPTPPPPVMAGDADCNNAVNAVDALSVLRFAAEMQAVLRMSVRRQR